MFLNSGKNGLMRINSTGPISSDLLTGLDILHGRDLTGTILMTNAITGLKKNGFLGPLPNSNSGIRMVTELLKVSNTGTRVINRPGFHGLTLRTGRVSPGNNLTGVLLRMLKILNHGL